MIEKTPDITIDFSKLPRPFLPDRPEWVEIYDFSWKLAENSLRRYKKRVFLDIAWDPERALEWVWDTCFTALFSRYGAGMFPGINGLDNFYDLQREDGYISMTYDLNTGKEAFPNRINPPLFAWTEWEYCKTTGDNSRLARVIPHIERHMDWIDANRLNPPHYHRSVMNNPGVKDYKELPTYQLYYFEDCGSSGMDDSPRTPRKPDAGMFFDWIDLSAQMALSFKCLGMIHQCLGNAEKADYWTHRATKLGDLINSELWCEATSFYHDRSIPTNFVSHKTAAGFWPMLAGICPTDRIKKLVAHLKDKSDYTRPDFVGWSAIGPVAMLIENILGIDLDMNKKQLTWDIRLTEEHGLENMSLGNEGKIDLKCARRTSSKDEASVKVSCDLRIDLKLRRGRTVKNIKTEPGTLMTVVI